MENAKRIYKEALRMLRLEHRDIKELALSNGIEVTYRDDFKHLFGMYVYAWRHRMIFLNGRLEEPMQSMVLAHEIGHDRFHRKQAQQSPLKEFTLFDMKDTTEYEANAFAAHLLLPDEDVMDCLKGGMDMAQTASSLNVNINMLLIKLAEMNRLGMDLPLPFEPDGSFFRKIQV